MFNQYAVLCWKLKHVLSALILTMLISSSVFAGLRLELSISKKDYLLHEPLYVTVKMKNAGLKDAYFFNALNPAWSILSLVITPPGEKARPYGRTSMAGLPYYSSNYKDTGLRLSPGDEYSDSLDLTNEMVKDSGISTLLRKPGVYRIQAVYETSAKMPGGPLRLKSNILRLSVEKPRGSDKLACDILISAAKKNKDHRLWSYNKTNAGFYETIIREYPNSRYYKYAVHSLAGAHTIPYLVNREAQESRLEMVKAVDLYRSIIEDTKGTQFGVQVAFQAAFAASRAKMPVDAAHFQEEAFLSPAATTQDRISILSQMKLSQSLKLNDDKGTSLVSLGKFAGAMGFSVNWDSGNRIATITRKGIKAKLYLDKGVLAINKDKYSTGDVLFVDEDCNVSNAVIAILIAKQYGENMEKALENVIAVKLPPDKS